MNMPFSNFFLNFLQFSSVSPYWVNKEMLFIQIFFLICEGNSKERIPWFICVKYQLSKGWVRVLVNSNTRSPADTPLSFPSWASPKICQCCACVWAAEETSLITEIGAITHLFYAL